MKRLTVLACCLGFALLFTACGDENSEGDGDEAPGIPHEVTATDDATCLSCHQNGDNGAPTTPHPGRANCVGCHQ
jgi:hypothetical protein